MAKKSFNDLLSDALISNQNHLYKVPDNWIWTNLKSFASNIQYGYTSKSDINGEGVKYLRITDIQNGTVDWSKVPYCDIDEKNVGKYKLNDGDIVVARTGATTGKNHLIKDIDIDTVFASYLIRISPIKPMNPKYLSWFMESNNYWQQISEVKNGIAQPGANAKKIGILSVPMAPIAEQQRIVNCIESLFEKVDNAQELIEEARDGFEKRREAILAKAFRGELTSKWRDENICKYSGSELISDLGKSRESRYNYLCEEAKLKKQRKPKTPRFMKEPSNELFDELIPLNWKKSYIYEIGDVELGGTPSRKEQSYWGGNIPWLSSGEVANNSISNSRETITTEGLNNSNAKLYPIGTVLIAMIGEGKTRGQSALLEIEACTNQNVAGVIIDKSFINPKYVWYNFLFNYERNRGEGRGGNQPALNGQKVGELTIAIPPYEEQIEIVRVLNKLYDEELKISELVMQKDEISLIKKSILAKAFRGELGTNDPDEESSLELLKEILNEKHEGIKK